MSKECSKCGSELVRGLAYRLTNGAFAVRFDKNNVFDKSEDPIMNPPVCKMCGFVEWYVDRPEVKLIETN